MTDREKVAKAQQEQNKDAAVKPDPETLHTTDPQERMEGPVSSVMQKIKDSGENDESKPEADRRKEENM